MITNEQKKFIEKYVDNKIYDKLVNYLERHDFAGVELFSFLGEDYEECAYHFIDTKIDIFIKRIPFYFYLPDEKEDIYERINTYISDARFAKLPQILEKDEEYIKEKLFDAMEILHFKYKISIKDIFEYPLKQTTRDSGITTTLFKWIHYIELAEKNNIKNLMPIKLIIDYNFLLEKEKLYTEIYCVNENMNYKLCDKNINGVLLEGVFPCDDNNRLLMNLIGIKCNNILGYEVHVDKNFKGSLFIETGPNSEVWVIDEYNCPKNQSDCWEKIFTGTLITEFDFSFFKTRRKKYRFSQEQVAQMIGATVRTYQKWEAGQSIPDGLFLLRLFNLFCIDDVNYCLKENDDLNVNHTFFLFNYYNQFAETIINRKKYIFII